MTDTIQPAQSWVTDSTYKALRDQLLLANEGSRSRLYFDTRGIPTIGDGIALVVKNNLLNKWVVDTGAVNALGDGISSSSRANLQQAADILNGTRSDEPQYGAKKTLTCFEISTRGTLVEMQFGTLDSRWQPSGWSLQPDAAAMQRLRVYKATERESRLNALLDKSDLSDISLTASQRAGLLSMVWQGREDAAIAAARAIKAGESSQQICSAAADASTGVTVGRFNAECSALTNGEITQYYQPKTIKTLLKSDLDGIVEEAVPLSSTMVAGGTTVTDAEAFANAQARAAIKNALAEVADQFEGETFNVTVTDTGSLLLFNDWATLELRRDSSFVATEEGGLVTESRLVEGRRVTVSWIADGSDGWGANSVYVDGQTAANPELALAALNGLADSGVVDGGQDALLSQIVDGNGTLVRTDGNAVTTTTLDSGGHLVQTVERDIAGHRVAVEFTEDEWGDLKASRVLTVDGQAPASAESFVNALNTQGYSVWDFADGQAPSGGTDVGSLYTAFNPMQPTGAQTLYNAIGQYGGNLIDALSIIKAIQSGDPLPIAVSGLRLANDISNLADIPNYNLSGAASVGSSILSILSLENALQRGDTIAAVTAGAQALSLGVQAYSDFAFEQALSGNTAFIDAAWESEALSDSIGKELPYLNLVNSIAHGDAIGAAVAVTDMVLMDAAVYTVPYIGWAYAVYSIVSSLFGDEDPPPEPWGSAAAGWSGYGVVANAAGEHGGYEAAQGTLNQFIAQLNSLAAYEQSVNPGSAIGVVANRLPSITYRNYTGFQLTDIDPITGVQRNPEIKYDLTGRPYNAPPGSDQASQSLSERFIRVALARGAVAPMWEVQTAAIQTQAGDPQAGLTEEERAGRNGLLAPSPQPSPATGGGSQTWRPVALDLNGDGVQTAGAARTVAFDVDDSGYLKNTAWLSNSDGFLFLDRNLNGSIDSGRELFSNSIVDLSARGLAGMRWVDSNYDGKLTAADPVWNELKIWQDADGDGQADAGETQTLSALGITALDYAMGRFEQNGQLQEMSSPDLAADTQGTRIHVVPEGIIVETTSGHTSLLVTRVVGRTMIEANWDEGEAANGPLYFCERMAA